MNAYKYPIDSKALYQGKKLQRKSVEESVRRHVYLILMTNLREYKYDPDYGNQLWDIDFDISINDTGWESEISEILKENIKKNEPRLDPNFKLNAKVIKSNKDNLNERQQFIISISGMVLMETNEKIDDISYSIVFSPISIST